MICSNRWLARRIGAVSLPLLPQELQEARAVLLDACVTDPRDLLQGRPGHRPRLDHLRQLLVREDRVDRHGLSLGNVLAKIAEAGEDREVAGTESLAVVHLVAGRSGAILGHGPWSA